MAPSQKRKPIEDDFIHTISDTEDLPVEDETAPSQPPKKKAKTTKKDKVKKQNEDAADVEAEPEGIWGKNEEDDGAMDSDFEFADANVDTVGDDEFEGWGFEGAKKGMSAEKRGVDLDEIIRRRREKKGVKAAEDNAESSNEEAEDGMQVDLDDDDDEVLADDAFGMNAGSDEEGSDGEEDGEEEAEGDDDDDDDDDAASDNDSVATPVEHPDDNEASDTSDQEDAEEAAKRDAFFAEGEKEKVGKKTDAASFQAMSLSRPILRGLASVGFSKPTPIQSKTIPIALMGKDLVGGAVTGSGKTGAFVVPILERLLYRPKKIPTTRVVILTPTRELAIQCHAVATKLAAHTDIKFTLAVGGLSLKVQEAELRLRPDVIIATPGRFIDHMRNSASFNVDTVEILVLDEADRMLEDGFADELNEILTTLPKSRQTMLFSATMTSTVDRLIRVGLDKPVRLMVDAQKKTVTTLVQEFVRLRPGREEKRMGYLIHLCRTLYTEKVIIFFRQKKEAHRARIIFGLMGLRCAELHGSMNQAQRIASVEEFRDGKVPFLLATDLASRGLDIKGVDSVINYEAPQSLEIYVHRVGRTARAGRHGTALTIAAEPDRKVVKAAVKAGKAQGAKIISRVVEASEVDKLQAEIDDLEDEIEEIMKEEKEEKQLAQAEMQVRKGENLIEHEAEIKSRPRRTWFETQHDKKTAKQAGKDELNGMREAMKKKNAGKLSNKDKKRLDAKAMRTEGRSWKKGKTSEAEMKAKAKTKSAKKAANKGKVKTKMPGKAKARRPESLRATAPCQTTGSPEATLQHLGCSSANVHHPAPLRFRLDSPLDITARRCMSLRSGFPYKASVFLRPLAAARAPAPSTILFRAFGSGRRHPRHRQGFFRHLIPRAVRARYRERLLDFRLNTLPLVKHKFQSLIYGFIVKNQRKRAERTRLVDAVARQGRRLLLGPRRQQRQLKHGTGRPGAIVRRNMPTIGGMPGGYGPTADDTQANAGAAGAREYGYKRKKLAAMAGSIYRSGQAAVTEIRESYAQTRTRGFDADFDSQGNMHIPGSFPDAAIIAHGTDQMVLFPSYAKQHIKQDWSQETAHTSQTAHGSIRDEEYWRREWERNEDEKAIVDVDVRGWIYSPHVAPMTRRNRILVGLARQLSGLPAPKAEQAMPGGPAGPVATHHQMHEDMREQEKIAREAARIERQGQEEKQVAYRGGYSEKPQDNPDQESEGMSYRGRRGSATPESAPGSPVMPARQASTNATELTEAELAVANANLMARIAPFMTNPLVSLPITLFFYNDKQSQSRTVMTNDAGHFNVRAPLDFIPTNVRVLANERLSAIQEIKIIEPFGVSLISDIDDTVKRSNISAGAREIFRNTFIRELADLTVDGVRDWYSSLHELGVSFHYCSNSPWQLFPVLATFFKLSGLPPGSLHLRQYSGMLQGIFEPVAERKKGTLQRLMRDFPTRKFLLVGDSGEADLEVYTELALAHPGRILAVFIRDVTTPEEPGYFDSGFDLRRVTSNLKLDDTKGGTSTPRQNTGLAAQGSKAPHGPTMGTLIDFSDEPEEIKLDDKAALAQVMQSRSAPSRTASSADLLGRKPPPPRPAKPVALRSSPSVVEDHGVGSGTARDRTGTSDSEKAPPLPRRPVAEQSTERPHPLAQMQNSSQQTIGSNRSTPNLNASREPGQKPVPPLPRRRGVPSGKNLSPRLFGYRSSNSDVDFEPLPPAATPPPPVTNYSRSGTRSSGPTPTGSPTLGPVNRKLEMWKRRLSRAHELLDQQGVALYTWRKGQDVSAEAVGIVKQAMQDMQKKNKNPHKLEQEWRREQQGR
ncbi:ATP-dependent RNA helicase DRS1 [Paramyrothecium foliicola]|nr:ATP-dependent RNA helicase DRS1 [Paramyrothecium foliicola]